MKKAIVEKIGVVLGMLAFIVAASDGPYFPWINFSALAILAGIVAVMNSRERKHARLAGDLEAIRRASILRYRMRPNG